MEERWRPSEQELEEITIKHVKWIDSYGAEGECANLAGADLSLYDLSAYILDECNLESASLYRTKLRNTQLQDANLRNTNLCRAEFGNTYLVGADLSNATCGQTRWHDLDLREVKGLEAVNHILPSSINFGTLDRSYGQISADFMRACGLSEWDIEHTKFYNPELSEEELTQISQAAIQRRGEAPDRSLEYFIRYSEDDRSLAYKLRESLENIGIRAWINEREMLLTDDSSEKVEESLRNYDRILLCCSASSLLSDWMDNEIATIFEKEEERQYLMKRKVKLLYVVDVDGFLFSNQWKSGYSRQVKSRLLADFVGWERDEQKFEKSFERMKQALPTQG